MRDDNELNDEAITLLIGRILKTIYKDRLSKSKEVQRRAKRDLERFPFSIPPGVVDEMKKRFKKETGKEWDE